MKIVMLEDGVDGDVKVWSRGEMFAVEDTESCFYIIKTIGKTNYAINKDCVNDKFIEILEL